MLDFEKMASVTMNVSDFIKENLKSDPLAVKDLWDHILRAKETVRERRNLVMPPGMKQGEE